MSTPHLKINRNKDGVAVTPAQVWKDLDIRMRGRHVRVAEVKDGFAHVLRCQQLAPFQPVTDRVTVLSIRRMHKHSTGWALVKDAVEGEPSPIVTRVLEARQELRDALPGVQSSV